MAKQKTGGAGKSSKGSAAKTPAPKTPKGEADAAPAKRRRTNPFEFIQQVRNEGAKVTWTPRNEVIVSTVMVMIMIALAGLFFFLADQLLRWIFSLLF